MIRPPRSPRLLFCAWLACAAIGASILTGCNASKADKKPVALNRKYDPIQEAKQVPPFMRNTIWEKVDLGNIDPFQVSGYGLVVNLDNTGDTTAPVAVKEYIVKQILKHQFGSKLLPGYTSQTPERILRDKRVAIVQVLGLLPPGIRKNQSFDVIVQALPKNATSSLAGGELYQSELRINGADPHDPFGKVNDYAVAKGFLFVNPAYALNKDVKTTTAARTSLRNGVIMDGAVAKYDRPIFLRLRIPETRVSRYIEQRIIDRFQDTSVAQAEDEGIVQIFVPYGYNQNWEHFTKLVTHLYLDGSPEFLATKAKMLVAEAQKPDAMLEDISYCWEGIGPAAIPFLTPLLTDKRPEIAFAAARAGAFIGDPTGSCNAALLEIARNNDHPFQLNAIETLGSLPPSSAINQMVRELLSSDKLMVRIEAYKVLARNHDPTITTRVVTEQANNQKYVVDVVPSKAPPTIFATRTGMPRIALIGTMPEISTPVVFSAMDDRLTISSQEVGNKLTIFYRTPARTDPDGRVLDGRMSDPVKMSSDPDLFEVVQRLGGIANDNEKPLNFTYSEVVAILAKLDKEKYLGVMQNGVFTRAEFSLQPPPRVQNLIYNAPSIDTGRPQGDEQPRASKGIDPAAEAALTANGAK